MEHLLRYSDLSHSQYPMGQSLKILAGFGMMGGDPGRELRQNYLQERYVHFGASTDQETPHHPKTCNKTPQHLKRLYLKILYKNV